MNKESFRLSDYDETIRAVLDSGGEFRIYPKGTSMLPLLAEGRDSVSLTKPAALPERNDIAFYRRDDGSYILHRIIKVKGDTYVMCGDNQLSPETGVSREQIIAVVSRVFKGDKEISLGSVRYRLYCLAWSSFFLRRVYFKLRRTFHGKKGQ